MYVTVGRITVSTATYNKRNTHMFIIQTVAFTSSFRVTETERTCRVKHNGVSALTTAVQGIAIGYNCYTPVA